MKLVMRQRRKIMKDFLYLYNATIDSVYDGDTMKLFCDLGFGIRHKITARLYGINTPEMKGKSAAQGTASRNALLSKITDEKGEFVPVVIQTKRDLKEKFGRYLAIIFVEQTDGSFLNVNEWLVENGFAVEFMTD